MLSSTSIDMPAAARPDRLVDSETGIIRWLSEIPIEPGEPEVFNFSAKMSDSSRYHPVGCYDTNGGAGLTRDAAFYAALGEAVERYCCSVYFPDCLSLGSYRDVARRMRALHPREIALFHPAQRDKIRYAWFTEDTTLSWTEGRSLTANEPILIPACLVFIPYFPFSRHKGEVAIASSISTGQACALTLGQALLGGLYEIVERDAFMISWLNRLPLPRLDIASSPIVSRIFRERFQREHLEYSLFQMATDIEIPAVLCMMIDRSHDSPLISFGGAANLDAEKATVKALVEAAQTREWAKFLGMSSKPVIIENDYSNIDDFDKHVFLYAYGDMMQAIEFLLDSPKEIPLREIGDGTAPAGAEELQRALAAVEAKCYEIMVVDLTTPDVRQCGYNVVKVLIPQLQAMEGDYTHRYLGGSRLYEVPAKLGFVGASSYETLNPFPHPYP
jgi:ribosomal protein S12 methylthiotransferase accessory factor